MSETKSWIGHLQDAIGKLDGLEIDERARRTLKRACAASIEQAIEDDISAESRRNANMRWSGPDLEAITSALEEAPECKSYPEEQVILEMLSLRFGRPAKSIKRKAIELGYASKVDYWLNRHLDGSVDV